MNQSSSSNPDENTFIGNSTTDHGPQRLNESTPAHISLEAGDSIGKFEIKQQLGVGGMGAVYLAYDPDLKRDVAIKVLNDSISGNEMALARFRSEAQAAGNLNHPNVVSVYEIGESDGFPYMVMEFVPKGSVVDLLKQQSPLSLVESTRIICDSDRGLAAAHEAGLIHRDIKPANLMIGNDDRIKVADFGLARPEQRDDDAGMTQAGQILGTPYFMSPEQCQGSDVDARSDLYSLGATYFMLLTGSSPFEDAASTMAILAAHLHEAPPDPKQLNNNVPYPCVRIIHRLLAKDPNKRYQNAKLLLEDLIAFLVLIKDPESAKEFRYRGSVSIPRETFELPSEKSGQMTMHVDPGGTRKPSSSSKDLDQTVAIKKAGSWFGSRTKSQPALQSQEDDQTVALHSPDPTSGPAAVNEPIIQPARRSLKDQGYHKEVFSVSKGKMIFWWPETITQEDASEAQQWMDLLSQKLKRVANESGDRTIGLNGD